MDEQSAVRLLADPNLDPTALAQIAQQFPELWPQVLVNPSIYPGLSEWILSQAPHLTPLPPSPPSAEPEPPAQPSVEPTPVVQSVAEPVCAEELVVKPSSVAQSPQQVGGKPRRKALLGVLAGIVMVALVGAGAWWFLGHGGGGGDLGSEQAIAAGQNRAARLADGDETVTKNQTVYGPSLFFYEAVAEDLAVGSDDLPYLTNQILIDLPEENDFKAVERAADEFDAVVVGVNEYARTYQLLLDEPLDEQGVVEVAARAAGLEGIAGATPNLVVGFTVTAEDGSDTGPTATPWGGAWGAELEGGKVGGEQPGNWGMQAIGAPVIWNYAAQVGLRETKVGIVDFFPADASHDALAFTVVGEHETGGPNDVDSWHGLHVTGTISGRSSVSDSLLEEGRFAGVAPNAEVLLVPIRSEHRVGPFNLGSDKRVLIGEGVYSVMSQTTALIRAGARAVNLSLGANDRDSSEKDYERFKDWGTRLGKGLATLIQSSEFIDERGKDFLLVASSGNGSWSQGLIDATRNECKEGTKSGDDCDFPDDPVRNSVADDVWVAVAEQGVPIVTVGAVGRVGSSEDYESGFAVAAFSDADADVLAPGDRIASTTDRQGEDGETTPDPNGYMSNSGTSMAAPHVTGVATVLWGINPALSAAQVKQIILESGTDAPGLNWKKDEGVLEPELTADGSFVPLLNAPAAMQVAIQTKGKDSEEAQAILDAVFASSVPADLQGTWCPADELGTDAENCLNLGDVVATDGYVTGLEPVDATGRASLVSTFSLCAESACDDGEGLIDLAYYPPGAQWECVVEESSKGCDANQISELVETNEDAVVPHDVGWPRLVQRYYEDGMAKQGAPLLLNLQTDREFPDLPSSLIPDADPWPSLAVSQFQLARLRGWEADALRFAVSKRDTLGAIEVGEGPSSRLWDDLGEIASLSEETFTTVDGEAYQWRDGEWDSQISINQPRSLSVALGLTGPVAQIERLVCYGCQAMGSDPLPKGWAVLYQDGSAEFVPDYGQPKPYFPTGTVQSISLAPNANVTFLTNDGAVYRASFDSKPVKYTFTGPGMSQACSAGPDVFALTGSGKVLVSEGFSQNGEEVSGYQEMELPDSGGGAALISCSAYSFSSSRIPFFQSRVFIAMRDGSLYQYLRKWDTEEPLLLEMTGISGNVVAVQDDLALTAEANLFSLDTPWGSLWEAGDGIATVGMNYPVPLP